MKREFELNEDTYILAKKIVQDEGLDIDTAINIFLKKITKEESISFLFVKNELENKSPVFTALKPNAQTSKTDSKITKSIAKRLFIEKGIKLKDNCIFASENSSTHIFWANIHYSVLANDWMLILNDKSKQILHLLSIPANDFSADDLVMRADKPEVIDLQIAYNDPTFTDNRSGIGFSRYIVDSIQY